VEIYVTYGGILSWTWTAYVPLPTVWVPLLKQITFSCWSTNLQLVLLSVGCQWITAR